MNYENPQLLKLARGAPCLIGVHGVCLGDTSTTVACHSNKQRHGKGKGIKAHDCFVAFGCYACHYEIDQGKRLIEEEKDHYWQKGFEATVLYIWMAGLIVVNGHKPPADRRPNHAARPSKILPRPL